MAASRALLPAAAAGSSSSRARAAASTHSTHSTPSRGAGRARGLAASGARRAPPGWASVRQPPPGLASTAPMFLPKNFLDRGEALPSHSRCDPRLPDRVSLPPGGPHDGEGHPVLPIPILDTDTDPEVFGKRWTLGARRPFPPRPERGGKSHTKAPGSYFLGNIELATEGAKLRLRH